MPVPERLTDWGLPVASSVIVTTAERNPTAAGLKLTLTAQFVPTATDEPQLLVWEKSAALVPETLTPVMLRAVFPVFVTVMACADVEVLTG